jgi:hypothetical protein
MNSFSKSKRLILPLLVLLIAGLVVPAVLAQETTAGLQGTVKDPSGAVVSGATVGVTSAALIGTKTVTTDAGGYFRFANLPPGSYTVTVTAPNFRSSKQDGVVLATGHLPSMDVTLQVGTASETVEVSGVAPIVDVTQSKVQTNVTEDVLASVPKGRSFQSVIQFAPGARSEPLQGGYQIDGASNSENSYLVEGQETASIQSGASATNIPMEFIQEVQIKSSGFEAEYGGALGGVVNVIQKRGSNQWHGNLVLSVRNQAFNAAPSRTLRYNPQLGTNGQFDTPVQSYQANKDRYTTLDPGFDVGGYLLKDRLWVFAAFVPDIDRETRTVNFAASSPNPGRIDFPYANTTYFSQARVDFLATQKIRLFGSWNYAYQKVMGNAWPGADNPYGLYNASSVQNRTNYNYQVGYVAPNVVYNTGADITLTPNLVATTRYGYTFTDYQDRGLPVGIRYQYRNSNYSYGGVAGTGKTALDGTAIPAAFALPSGYASIGANTAYLYDKFSRNSFSQDVAYFKKGWGTHNLKAGYQLNRLWNSAINGYNTAQAYIAYGTSYKPLVSNRAACAAITASNAAPKPGFPNGWGYRAPGTLGETDLGLVGGVSPLDAASGTRCQGLWGTVNFREYGEFGAASSFNHALYFQDAWTVGHGVTLNLGLRFDKESVPSYTTSFPGISFGFGQKAAPRLGASWDMFGNGKLKVYGSYGWFFDIMKYEMPKGSFGGNFWHDCVYAMDTPDWTTLVPARAANGHFCNASGGANFAGAAPTTLRFIENQDFRTYSNDPSAPGSFGPTGYIDPNLKPMKQHEYVFGADWAIRPTLALETRYSRKRLDRTIEDAGIFTPAGEQYYIINPGFSHDVQPIPATDCTACPTQPKAIRRYDGLEFRLTKRSSSKWFGSLSYTYSRLQGNYSGLTSTDVSDGGAFAARNSPNVDRNFDEPFMQFDAHGRVVDGPLATDRPHTFKAFGYYRLRWWKFETMLGAYQQWYSGTPLSTYMNVDGNPVFVEGRGKWVNYTQNASGTWVAGSVTSKRTAAFSQTDFNLVQEMHVSKTNEKLVAAFEANITNLFNQHSPLFYGQTPEGQGSAGIGPDIVANIPATSLSGYDYLTLMKGYNYTSLANDGALPLSGQYGIPYSFQAGRQIRFRIRFSF